jgi:hypothetical protein
MGDEHDIGDVVNGCALVARTKTDGNFWVRLEPNGDFTIMQDEDVQVEEVHSTVELTWEEHYHGWQTTGLVTPDETEHNEAYNRAMKFIDG